MTKGCHTKFKKENLNQNYFYNVSIGIVLLAVLYCYRFLFVVLTLSYGLGCAACYLILDTNVLQRVLEKIIWKHEGDSQETSIEEAPKRGCTTCGLKDCGRHDDVASSEPWVGLRIHKQLDQAIEDFYNAILDEFINSWYSKITLQPFFVDELRHRLRYASACLLRRALKIDYTSLITSRLLPCALHHLSSRAPPPPAAASRAAELKYLRSVADAIAPTLLPPGDLNNEVFHLLIREVFAGWVLLSLTDVLAEPHILNSLLVLATGDETMAQLPATPNYHVEFLENFARQRESVYTQRCKLLKWDLEQVLDDQEMFYAFMQFLKTTSHIHLLQFYKDIKSFQTKLLNPALGERERRAVLKDASYILNTYFGDGDMVINLDESVVSEMKSLLSDGSEDSIPRLQRSRALYQAARQSRAALGRAALPRFLHSDEFYKLVIGSRIPTGYHKQMTKKPDKLAQTAQRLGNKIKSQQIDNMTSDGSDIDILQYLDSLLAEENLEHDLTGFRAAIADVEVVEHLPPRRGPVRVFTLAVHVAPPSPAAPPALLAPRRSEHDFHLLDGKLHEFHGHVAPRQLPSRRDNSPLETLRYKYEDYLQRLLMTPLLRTSELLHLFLTVEGDFSLAVQASSLGGNGTDLTNIYQTVAHRLKKEKGQHLEGFLKNFLLSSDMERYQALKQNTAPIEEAFEASDDATVEKFTQLPKKSSARDITTGVFGDNFGVEPVVELKGETQNTVKGFVQCLMYLLHKVLHAPAILTAVVGAILCISKDAVDQTFNRLLDRQLRSVLNERRLAHLIRLGHGVLFNKKLPPSLGEEATLSLARRRLPPPPAARALCPNIAEKLEEAFDMMQSPQFNKQLVYELLDLCLAELFPELCKTEEDKNTR